MIEGIWKEVYARAFFEHVPDPSITRSSWQIITFQPFHSSLLLHELVSCFACDARAQRSPNRRIHDVLYVPLGGELARTFLYSLATAQVQQHRLAPGCAVALMHVVNAAGSLTLFFYNQVAESLLTMMSALHGKYSTIAMLVQ